MTSNARFQPAALKSDLARAMNVASLTKMLSDSLDLAYRAHLGQWREPASVGKDRVPYIVHPVGVAKLAVQYLPYADLDDDADSVIAACLLHDVLEDSETSLLDIERASTKRAAALVLALTKPEMTDRRSRTERNQAFLQQIVDAGATARFIKACDAAHNLGRPDAMPLRLLEKSVQKAGGYLTLANVPQVGAPLLEELQRRVTDAKHKLEARSAGAAGVAPENVELALTILEKQASGKTLEIHDIAELLTELSTATSVLIGSTETIVPGEGTDGDIARRRLNLAQKANQGWVKPSDAGLVGIRHSSDEQRCLIVDVGHIFSGEIYVAAVFGASLPDWLGPATFRTLALRCFDRLRGGQHQRWLDVLAAISRLHLDLEPDLVAHARLSIPQLEALKDRLESAEFVRRNAVAAVERIVSRSRYGMLLDRIESRTKAPQSIILKMAKREIASFDDLDDLVGLRVIAASRKAIKTISEDLAAALVNPASDLARMLGPIASSVTDKVVTSSSGYTARHICFQAMSPSMKFDAINCELQLRTLQEDAWARTSHLLLYKDNKGKGRTRASLHKLSEMRDASDSLIDQI
jgi:ppGpp synthetase/RelA/SpoT-type nucleotidyltranferase